MYFLLDFIPQFFTVHYLLPYVSMKSWFKLPEDGDYVETSNS
jgi:hypothetical protein